MALEVFGKRLKKVLSYKNMSQKELSKRLFLSESAISAYVNNNREPEYEVLRRMSRVLGISCDYLLGGNEIALSGRTVLDESEWLIIQMYRRMNTNGKRIVLSLVTNFSEEYADRRMIRKKKN